MDLFSRHPIAQIQTNINAQGTTTSETITYIHNDHLFTPRLMTDTNQTVVWRWDSDAFGEGNVDNDPDGDNNKVYMPLRFPGQMVEEPSGLYYNYFRDYDPKLGRYIQSDPIGLDGGMNTFGYVESNPLDTSDPFGLRAIVRPRPGGTGAELVSDYLDTYLINPAPGDLSDIYYCALAHCDDGSNQCTPKNTLTGTDWAGSAAPSPWGIPDNCTCLFWGVR